MNLLYLFLHKESHLYEYDTAITGERGMSPQPATMCTKSARRILVGVPHARCLDRASDNNRVVIRVYLKPSPDLKFARPQRHRRLGPFARTTDARAQGGRAWN